MPKDKSKDQKTIDKASSTHEKKMKILREHMGKAFEGQQQFTREFPEEAKSLWQMYEEVPPQARLDARDRILANERAMSMRDRLAGVQPGPPERRYSIEHVRQAEGREAEERAAYAAGRPPPPRPVRPAPAQEIR